MITKQLLYTYLTSIYGASLRSHSASRYVNYDVIDYKIHKDEVEVMLRKHGYIHGWVHEYIKLKDYNEWIMIIRNEKIDQLVYSL